MKKKHRSSDLLTKRRRILLVAFGMFGLFSLLTIQFYKIQIIEEEKWLKQAKSQHQFHITETFRRGAFFSNTAIRNGHPEQKHPFVIDVQKFHLYIDPFSISFHFRDEIAMNLLGLIDVPQEDHFDFREQFNKNKSRSRKLAMWLDKNQHDQIMKWWRPYAKMRKIPSNAVYLVSDYKRSYPFGNLLGQVLHTIRDNKDELTKQGIPTGGMELEFNDFLKGSLGKKRLTRSPYHLFDDGTIIEAPQNGADVYLTINHHLQAIAEEELAKGVEMAQAKGGWVMMMNPKTGEILALAQYPFFFRDLLSRLL